MFHVAFHTYFVRENVWKLEPSDFDNLQYTFTPDVVLSYHFSKPKNLNRIPLIPELQPYATKYEKKRKDEGCTLDGVILAFVRECHLRLLLKGSIRRP